MHGRLPERPKPIYAYTALDRLCALLYRSVFCRLRSSNSYCWLRSTGRLTQSVYQISLTRAQKFAKMITAVNQRHPRVHSRSAYSPTSAEWRPDVLIS